MDVQSINPASNYGMNDEEEYLWNQLEEAEQVTELDLDVFDDVEVDYNLPENVPAATKHGESLLYDNTVLAVNEDFFYLPEDEQNHILAHEGVHGNMFNDTLDDQLKNLGLSNEAIDFFKKKMSSGEKEMEGATEYLAQLLDPNSDRISLRPYPYETEKIRKEAKNEGIDVESDLAKEIEAYTESILEEHVDHEIYGIEAGDDYIIEYGELEGVPYSSLEIHGDPESEDFSDDYETIEEYLSDSEYELEYGEGANYVGNIDQEHEVPLSASMGTPANGYEE